MTRTDLPELRFYSVAAIAAQHDTDQTITALAAISFLVEATDIGTAEKVAIERAKKEFPGAGEYWAELALIKDETILHMAEVVKCQT